jgi:aspartyl/asparaginyl beta-hydroxylase (cupin superfamily)
MMQYFFEDRIDHIPVCVDLLKNFKQVQKEIVGFCSQPESLQDYPNYAVKGYESIYQNYWKAAPLSVFKDEHVELNGTPETTELLRKLTLYTRSKCPTVASIISNMEDEGNLANSFISRLVPGSIINPHVGWSTNWMRVHLGITCDPGCKMMIEDETNTWEEGKFLAFVDGPPHAHSVVHLGTKERIILSMDIRLSYIKDNMKR